MVIDDPVKFHLLTADMKKQIIKAGIGAVNIVAANARKEAIKSLKSNFTTRNTFTARQIQFTPMAESKYINLSAIQSVTGITEKASYMLRQEEGGTHSPRQGTKLAIPTDAARGGSFRSPVQKGMRVKDIRQKRRRVHGEAKDLLPKYRGRGRKRVLLKRTRSQKSWFVSRAFIGFKHDLFVPMGGSGDERNLFSILSFKTIGKGEHRKVKFETEQVYNFERAETRTKARPWFYPACEKAASDIEKIFISQMKKAGL